MINVSYKVMPELKITPFVYLFDFEDDSPANSVNNYGVRLTGDIWRDADDEKDLYFDYELTYARQTDSGSNAADFEAGFFAAQARVNKKGTGAATLGYQFLGSDDGKFGFRFPLGTNHKFQGFADTFLVTPATGLQDFVCQRCVQAALRDQTGGDLPPVLVRRGRHGCGLRGRRGREQEVHPELVDSGQGRVL